MRFILLTALIALWAWFAIAVAPRASHAPRPVVIEKQVDGVTAETLHNMGVSLNHMGRPGDALAYFERAESFKPLDPVFAKSAALQRSRLEKRAWIRFLVPATVITLLVVLVGSIRSGLRSHRDRRRLRRLRLRGDRWFRIRSGDDHAELPLRFNHEVAGLLDRHPLTVVWSSARHGKHMKSRPPVDLDGRKAVIRLDGERLERLRRYPGEWKGFFYLDGREVGEAIARVG
ncbi:MAG: tetratricopeptide repeat protein [Planctomycetota bacterium]|jgi:hypothetical protein